MRIFPLHKGVFYGVVLILVIILVVLTKMAFSPVDKLTARNFTPVSTLTPSPTPNLCDSLTTGKGEISCEAASKLALANFPGQVLSVSKSAIPEDIKLKLAPKVKMGSNAWVVNIKPDNLSSILKDSKTIDINKIKTISAYIDREIERLLFFKLIK